MTEKYKMIGKRRPFNDHMFHQYDIPARKIIKEKLGDFVIENPDIYKQDFIIECPSCKYKYLEVQVITQWFDEIYPFKYPYIYERKAVYGSDTLFITFNKNMTKAFIFDRDSINSQKPSRLKKYDRELIFNVPWYRVRTEYVEDLSSQSILEY